ncbi:MAG: hypothetical protein NZT92_05445, partial [Abditibacteriales bacterium]|nr:hypothetical protein [Abditibacteriales bacterium]MDW8365413.1 hypothetical protein [Abditibacteriales bacterium]
CMIRRERLAFVVLLCNLLFTSHAFAVRLQYNVKKDDVWKLKTTMKGTGTADLEAGGQKQSLPMEMDFESVTTQKVTAVEADGTFESTVDYKSEKMKVTIGGFEPPIPPASTPKPITMKMNKFGKVLEIKGLDNAGGAGGPDFNRLFSAMPNVFPDKDLNVGDTWDIESPKEFPLKGKGKLLTVESGIAKVEYTVEIGLDALAGLFKFPGAENIKVSGKITGKTTTLINLANGMPTGGEGTMDMDITIEVPDQANIRQVIKMTLKMETVK